MPKTPPTAADVIGQLAPLKFKDLTAPCSDVSFDVEHDQAERLYPYIDGAAHDWTGRKSLKFKVVLHFLNTLEDDLYPHMWNKWKKNLFDGTPGDLVHPDVGKIKARVVHGSVAITAQVRAGIVVTIDFTETIEAPDKPTEFEITEIVDLINIAKNATADMAKKDIPYPRGDSNTDLFGAINSIVGQIDSFQKTISGTINQVNGKITLLQSAANSVLSIKGHIDKVKGVIKQIGDTVQHAADPSLWSLQAKLDQLNAGLDSFEKVARKKGRPIKTTVTTFNTTLDSVAHDVGNSVSDLMGLNPQLLNSPIIRKGETVSYFGSA